MTVFDFVALVIVVSSLVAGWKSGFIKTAVSLISLVVALVTAFVLAQPAATYLYERFWPDAIVLEQRDDSQTSADTLHQRQADGLIEALADESVSDKSIGQIVQEYNAANGTDYDLSGLLSVFGISPDDSVPMFVTQLSGNVDALMDGAEGLLGTGDTGQSFAEAFTRNLQRYLTVTLLTFAAFVVILIAVRLLMKLLGSLLNGIISKIPVLGGLNRLLGAALGTLLGIGLAFVFLVVLRQVALYSTNADFTQLVANTRGFELADQVSQLFLTAKAG